MSSEAFLNLVPRIHPTAWVHASAQILGDVELSEEVSVWPTSVLRGDAGAIRVGARTNFQDGAIAHATRGFSTTTIGAECTIGHRAIIHGCLIGNRCLIGMGSIVLDGAELGDECIVAAGSRVAPGKKYEPRSFLMGSPAKVVRQVGLKDLEMIERSWKVYQELANGYR
jgi:carbonic anhydrase/acetyltransferase-like protein (isoleucine patch superfamily)